MKFRLLTLVDITETRARKGENEFSYKQQQNLLTVIQTIGMRANPITNSSPEIKTLDMSKLHFGKAHRGKKTVWVFEFEFESVESHCLELLKQDFDFVPFIADLTENIKLKNNVFLTHNDDFKNIYFEELDK